MGQTLHFGACQGGGAVGNTRLYAETQKQPRPGSRAARSSWPDLAQEVTSLLDKLNSFSHDL